MPQEQRFTLHPDLLPELNEHIVSFLDNNDIACSLRSVNKAAAEKFKRGIVHLSLPVPPKVYYEHWARPDSTRSLSLKARHKLLCLTAASGVIANLELAIAVAGCLPDSEVFRAAAKAGRLHVCRWLHERCCPDEGALPTAAGAGHLEVCRWLLAMKPLWRDVYDAVKAAVAGGHLHVLDWLLGLAEPLQQHFVTKGIPNIATSAARGGHMEVVAWMAEAHPDKLQQWRLGTDLLAAAAQGCDLATLQRLHPGQAAGLTLLPPALQQQHEELAAGMRWKEKEQVMAAAAGSPTPDWRAKVEWLRDQEYPLTELAYSRAADCPDWAERLEWLRQQGFPPLNSFSDDGICTAVAEAAARASNLAALQSLRASGCKYSNSAIALAAAGHGHLHVMMWLAEARPDAVADNLDLLVCCAVESGNLELVEWLRAHGGPGEDDNVYGAVIGTGNVAAIERIVKVDQPCWFLTLIDAIKGRIGAGDLSTLRYLRSLGVPRQWPPGATFERVCGKALRDANDSGPWRWGGTTAFRWLLELGCPVDWGKAEAVVRVHGGPDEGALLALLAEWRQRRHLDGGEVEVDGERKRV